MARSLSFLIAAILLFRPSLAPAAETPKRIAPKAPAKAAVKPKSVPDAGTPAPTPPDAGVPDAGSQAPAPVDAGSPPDAGPPPPPPIDLEAVAARSSANAFLSAEQLPEALAAINQAISLAPQYAEAYATRARIYLAMAGPGSELTALAKPSEGNDYKAMVASLSAAAADLEKCLKLTADMKQQERLAEDLGQVRARLSSANRAQRILAERAEEAALLKQAEEIERTERETTAKRQKELEAKKAKLAAEERAKAALAAEQQAKRAKARTEAGNWRGLGIKLCAGGAGAALLGGGFAYLGAADPLKLGPTGQGVFSTIAPYLLFGGALVIVAGAPLIIFNPDTGKEAAKVSLALTPGGAGFVAQLSFP